MPEIHGLEMHREHAMGTEAGIEETVFAHTGNTIYSNLSLAREQAKQTVFSLEVAQRHLSCSNTDGFLELWGPISFRTGLEILLTIENKTNKQVLLKQPGGSVGEDLSVRLFCNLASLVYSPALPIDFFDLG